MYSHAPFAFVFHKNRNLGPFLIYRDMSRVKRDLVSCQIKLYTWFNDNSSNILHQCK